MSTTTQSQPQSPSSTPPDPSPQPPKKYNLRNPVPLPASQEGEVKQVYYKRVRGHCAPEIKAFAECAVNRTITATWVCRQQRLAMNGCMVAHATPDEEDRAREEWFKTIQARKKEREEEQRQVDGRRAEVVRLMKLKEDEARKAG